MFNLTALTTGLAVTRRLVTRVKLQNAPFGILSDACRIANIDNIVLERAEFQYRRTNAVMKG
jgi:hypothetical protein